MDGPSVLGQMAWFIALTLIYSYFEYSASTRKSGDDSQLFIYKSIYVLLAVIGQYFITVGVSAALCGTPQYYTSLFATAYPWIFIFGVTLGLLSVFPGWIMPFSNTLGYLVANAMGLGTLANNIFTKPVEGSKLSPDLAKAISFIYTDKASLLNNITPSNFINFWESSAPLRTPDSNTDEVRQKLKNFIILKNVIGTATWYLLTGLLVISISYNTIVNSTCSTSVKQLAQQADNVAQKQSESKTAYPTYVTSE